MSIFSGQDNRCARGRKNGNAELKSRAVNEIKNVLAEVANVYKERQIGFAWKRRKGGVGQMQGMENERKRWFAQLNEFPRFV